MKKLLLIFTIIVLSFCTESFSQTTASALDIAGNAYEKNIGYGSVGLFNNIGGSSVNPSIIPNINSKSGSLTYIDYLEDFNMLYGNFVYPEIKNFNILGKFGYFHMPSETDVQTGEELGYSEFFLGAGTGYHFLDKKLSVGAVINFYTASIAGESGSTIFFDVGANYPLRLPVVGYHKFIVGLSILNLGPGVSFTEEASPLPMNLNLGFQYIYDYDYKLFAGLRKYAAYEGTLFSLGGEIILLDSVFLRASIIEDVNNSIKYNMGLGFDINYSDYHFLIDYVFLPLEGQDTSTIITLSFKFPIKETEKKDLKKEEKNWENLWTSE